MSSYKLRAIRRKTDTECEVIAYDDYFGRHHYGYEVNLGEYEHILTEDEFHKDFEPVCNVTPTSEISD